MALILRSLRGRASAGLPGAALQPLLEGGHPVWRQYLYSEYHLHSPHIYYRQRAVRTDRFKLIQNLLPGEVNPGYDYTLDKYYGTEEYAAIEAAPTRTRDAFAQMRQPPAFELYDLKDDPLELNNLVQDPEYQTVLKDLQGHLETWREETSDPFLNHANVLRLQKEIAATKVGDEYQKRKDTWGYIKYMAPK